MERHSSLLTVLFLLVSALEICFPVPRPGCEVQRSHGMLGADCSQRSLTDIPNNLWTNIEILDVSTNRIRDLTASSFSRYTGLKFLYIGDNLINIVDENVFGILEELEVIDLSLNGLGKIPTDLMNLSSLRKIDFSQNRLDTDDPDTYKGASTSFTVQILNLAKNKLRKMPQLWMFPNVKYLNVSKNDLTTIKVTDLATMCVLKELDVSYNTRLFANSGNDACDCYLFKYWLDEYDVELTPDILFNCTEPVVFGECLNSSVFQEAQLLRCKCSEDIKTLEHKIQVKKTWMWVGVVVGTVLAGVFLVVVWVKCRKSARRRISSNNNLSHRTAGNLHLQQEEEGGGKKSPHDPTASQLLAEV